MNNHPNMSAQWLRRALFVVVLALAACGGGGGSDNNSSAANTNPPPTGAANAVPVTVAQGVLGAANIPTVSVTICAPGTSNCQTIPNVQVDTGSFGLRLMSSVVSPTVASALPLNTANVGGTLAECAGFADGNTWGTVRNADVTLGRETASAIPIQLIADLPTSSAPSPCNNAQTAKTQPSDIAANGILGIGVAPADYVPGQLQSAAYYGCTNGANCAAATPTAAQVVPNPVARFAADNNGVILQLPPIAATGAASATGTLYFGIGTESNNVMTATQRLATDAAGDVVATFNGQTVPLAFLDSGSNGLFFSDSSITSCGDWYCPTSTASRTAALTGVDGQSINVGFSVANATTLFNTGNLAYNDLGGGGSALQLDLGLPFFYGKTVYYGYGSSPFVAF
ncbi:MAG TPA: DUF3443 family protein [Paraburkholderia sp.]|jgi:hypothetical protein|nr:DUF3443 family protein [Paraburkholderia sp.]